jgi:hypothetical protein
MVINISVKLVDSSSSSKGTYNIAFWNGLYLIKGIYSTNSKQIHKQHPGSQLYMLIIIPVKFHDFGSTLLSYDRHKLKISNISNIYLRAITLHIPMCTIAHADQHSCKIS